MDHYRNTFAEKMQVSEVRKLLAVVPVRSGSKGLPDKNLRQLAGLPLYQHAVNQGLRIAGYCVVTTDIKEILSMPAYECCDVLKRPPGLAMDDTPMELVVHDLIRQLSLGPEVILLLQATTPLRLDSDIRAVLDLHAAGAHDLVMSVTPTDSGILKYGLLHGSSFSPVSRPEHCFSNRQSLPPVFRPNGAVYAFTADAFLRAGGWPSANIGAVEMPIERSNDIDTLDDFEYVVGKWRTFIPGLTPK